MKSEQEQLAIFAERFFRAYRLLDFIACRVFCDKKRVQIAFSAGAKEMDGAAADVKAVSVSDSTVEPALG